NKDAVNLAFKSADVFINRLKYFRAAFGISFLSSGSSLASDLRSLVFDLYKEKDIFISWSEKYDEVLESFLNTINIKLFLNIFLLGFYNITKSTTNKVMIVKINE